MELSAPVAAPKHSSLHIRSFDSPKSVKSISSNFTKTNHFMRMSDDDLRNTLKLVYAFLAGGVCCWPSSATVLMVTRNRIINFRLEISLLERPLTQASSLSTAYRAILAYPIRASGVSTMHNHNVLFCANDGRKYFNMSRESAGNNNTAE